MKKSSRALLNALDGDRTVLGDVLQAFRRYLMAIARRALGEGLQPKGGASDVVQETFLEAHRDFELFHGKTEAEFLAWLRKMLLNNIANFHRRYRATARRAIGKEISFYSGESSSRMAEEMVAATDPAEQAEAKEEVELLRSLMKQLPTAYEQVLTLWYEERSFDEIGRIMNRSTNASRMLWMRAVQHLQEIAVARPPVPLEATTSI